MNAPDLHRAGQLLDALCEGTIDAAGFVELDALACRNREARQLLVQYLELDGQLRWEFGTGLEGLGLVAGATDDQFFDAQLAKHAGYEPFVPSPSSDLAAILTSRTPVLGWLTSVSRRVPGGEFTVGSLVLLVLVAAFWGLSQAIMNPRMSDRALAPLAADKGRGAGGEGTAVATIRDTADVEWFAGKSEGRNLKSEIAANESLSIRAGLVELQLKQGTTLVIEGPAEWSIDGDNQASLERGKLVARVPPQAIGFTLKTPTALIVDLGTEFGVDVHYDGSSTVEILRGIVEARSTKQTAASAMRLVTGEAARFNRDDSSARVSANPARFARMVGAGRAKSMERLSGIHVQPARGEHGAFPALKDDLVNVGQNTLSAVKHSEFDPFSGGNGKSTAAALNDGATLRRLPSDLNSLVDGVFDEDGVWTSQFDLNVGLHPNGYTIDEIRSISEWIPSRCNQQYVVKYSTVGEEKFIELVRARYDGTNVNGAGLVTIRRAHGPLAVRVRSLRFEFEQLTGADSGDPGVYSEIDVIGSPTLASKPNESESPP